MLTTARLRLRHWRKEDLPPFAALNSDSQVMEYMPKLLDRTESDASAERINEDFVQYGFGLWAVEVIGVADFIGFTGLALPGFTAHFTPCVEISWRLARDYWGFWFCYGGRPARRATTVSARWDSNRLCRSPFQPTSAPAM